MSKANPLISVIIPVYNGAKFLTEALASVVGQTCRPLEIIVIDDGSTDDTAQIANTFFAGTDVSGCCVFQENQGPAAARNHGLSLASGEFIAFLDADDLWPANKLTDQLGYFAMSPVLDVLLGHTEVRRLAKDAHDTTWVTHRQRWLSPLLGCMLVRRAAFDHIGGFSPELLFGEDLDWLLRVRESNLYVRVGEELALIYRLHQGNMVQHRADLNRFSLMALRKSLQRRRVPDAEPTLPPLAPITTRVPVGSKTEQKPGISVIIPVYNGAQFINQALESVISQRYQPVEVIVVDDGSTDHTAQIVGNWPSVRYVQQRNQGNGAAKNLGLALATQPLVAFLDVDDSWLSEKLAMQVNHLLQYTDLGFVLCHMRVDLEKGATWPANLNETHYRSNPPLYAPSALLAWRSVFNQVGSFSTEYRRSNDSDWFLRARDAGVAMAIVPHVLVQKHIHAESITTSQTASLTRELMGALRASVRRRRKLQGED